MNPTESPPAVGPFVEHLQTLLDAGGSAAALERTINAFALPQDEQAVLWLWLARRRPTLTGIGWCGAVDASVCASQRLSDRLLAVNG